MSKAAKAAKQVKKLGLKGVSVGLVSRKAFTKEKKARILKAKAEIKKALKKK